MSSNVKILRNIYIHTSFNVYLHHRTSKISTYVNNYFTFPKELFHLKPTKA